MAKGQVRSNKEKRKPKAKPPKKNGGLAPSDMYNLFERKPIVP